MEVEQRREAVRVHAVNRAIKKKRCRRRTNRSPRLSVAPLIPVQKLYLSCLDVFKGPETVPSSGDVQALCRILDSMKPEDFGLSKDLQFFKPKPVVKAIPRVTYTTIYKCNNFSLCIFFLPTNAVIPLHNHPGMTVFSKLLLGTMHIKSYDFVDSVDSEADMVPSSPLRLAMLKANSIFTAPCDTSVLYPTTGGNIHAFTAITPCAVLDVLGPPYSIEDGRDCTYYKDIPYTALYNGEKSVEKDGERAVEKDGDNYGWLEEIEMPKESQMYGIPYFGPQIVETSC